MLEIIRVLQGLSFGSALLIHIIFWIKVGVKFYIKVKEQKSVNRNELKKTTLKIASFSFIVGFLLSLSFISDDVIHISLSPNRELALKLLIVVWFSSGWMIISLFVWVMILISSSHVLGVNMGAEFSDILEEIIDRHSAK